MGSRYGTGHTKLSQNVEALVVAWEGWWMGTWWSVEGELMHDLTELDVLGIQLDVSILDTNPDYLLPSIQTFSSIYGNEKCQTFYQLHLLLHTARIAHDICHIRYEKKVSSNEWLPVLTKYHNLNIWERNRRWHLSNMSIGTSEHLDLQRSRARHVD